MEELLFPQGVRLSGRQPPRLLGVGQPAAGKHGGVSGVGVLRPPMGASPPAVALQWPHALSAESNERATACRSTSVVEGSTTKPAWPVAETLLASAISGSAATLDERTTEEQPWPTRAC